MTDELFGPVLTIYVYPAKETTAWLQRAAATSEYSLTAALSVLFVLLPFFMVNLKTM